MQSVAHSSPSLDLARLEKVRQAGSKIIARCPACAETGGDRQGQHLVVLPSGKFACAAAQGDGEHRRRIFALAGLPTARTGGSGHFTAAASRAGGVRRQQLQQQERERAERQHRELVSGAMRHRAGIIARHRWEWVDVWEDSPQRLEGGPEELCPRHFLASLFSTESLLWTGETHHSGQGGRHAACWRTVAELRDQDPASATPGPMTTPAVWQPGTISRTASQVREEPYTVLDFDGFDGRQPSTPAEVRQHLTDSLAIVRWLREGLHWRLAALLFTGNKSLHAWFHTPAPAVLASLRQTAPQLGLDANLLGRPEHPCRLPGHPHPKTGRLSHVVWLAC